MPLRRGEVTFFIRATIVNDFTGRAPVRHAEFSGTDLGDVRGIVEVRVADMRTGIGQRDRHLREAMQADSFPSIRFELVGVEPGPGGGDTIPVTFQGQLTIHGVAKPVRVPGWLIVRPDAVDVTATIAIDMREFGVRPPVRMLGALRVHPVTQVTATLSFGAAPSP